MKTLIQSLAEAVESAGSRADRDEARISWACCAARYGRIEEARAVHDELRSKYQIHSSPRITIGLMILESVILYYSAREASSLDRARRAYLLAEALSQADLAGIAASVAAHYAFSFGDHDTLRRSLSTCFQRYSSLDEVGRARSALVLADGLQFTGDSRAAEIWYQRSRRHALLVHDHATMSAIEFNRLALGLSRERAEYFLARGDRARDRRRWETELESVRSFHAGVMNESLIELLSVCTILVHQVIGNFGAAAQLLLELRKNFSASVTRQSPLSLEIEWRWCKKQSGDYEDVPWDIDELDHEALTGLEEDDRLACYGMLSDLVSRSDHLKLRDEVALHFGNAKTAYLNRISDLSSKIQSIAAIAQQAITREAS